MLELDRARQTIRSVAGHVSRQSGGSAGPVRHRSPLLTHRDLEIFNKVAVEHCSLREVAGRYRLSIGRISQIVRRVRQELGQACPGNANADQEQAQQRLELKLEKMCLESALQVAAKTMRRDAPSRVERAGCRNKGGHKEDWRETVTRDEPTSVQSIKTYLRIVTELGKLHERAAAVDAPRAMPSDADLFSSIALVLEDWQRRALQCQADPISRELYERVEDFRRSVGRWIAASSANETSYYCAKACTPGTKPALNSNQPMSGDASRVA